MDRARVRGSQGAPRIRSSTGIRVNGDEHPSANDGPSPKPEEDGAVKGKTRTGTEPNGGDGGAIHPK